MACKYWIAIDNQPKTSGRLYLYAEMGRGYLCLERYQGYNSFYDAHAALCWYKKDFDEGGEWKIIWGPTKDGSGELTK